MPPARANGLIQLPPRWLHITMNAFNRMGKFPGNYAVVQLPEIYGRLPERLYLKLDDLSGTGVFGRFSPSARVLIMAVDAEAANFDGEGRFTPSGRYVLAHELRHFVQETLGGPNRDRGGPRRRSKGSLVGRDKPPFFGAFSTPLSDAEKKSVGLEDGVVIAELVPEGPAEKAGLLVNDIIALYEGEPIRVHSDLVKATSRFRPGDLVRVKILRQKKPLQVEVVLAERPIDPNLLYLLDDVEYQTWLGVFVDEAVDLVTSGAASIPEAIGIFQESEVGLFWRSFAPKKYRDALSTLYKELTRSRPV